MQGLSAYAVIRSQDGYPAIRVGVERATETRKGLVGQQEERWRKLNRTKIAMKAIQMYVYRWGNNPKRALLKGRRCRMLARLSRNSAVVSFVDTNQEEVVSRNALRKAT